uniref:Protein kinase domain-containing protein n=1 Tax=Panagrellus redivivus TaxID=6233 RepID=A0A7E4VYP9_PANRE
MRFLKAMQRLPDRPPGIVYPTFKQVINRKVLHESTDPVRDFKVRRAFYTLRRDSQHRYYVHLIEFNFKNAIDAIYDDFRHEHEYPNPDDFLKAQLLNIYGLHYLEHPNLVQALKTFTDVPTGRYWMMTLSQISVKTLMEKVPYGHFKDENGDCPFADFVVSCVLAAISFLQNGGLVHNNVKPDTVFIDANGRVQLGDFREMSVFDKKDPKSVVADVYGAGMVFAYIRNTKLVQRAESMQIGPLTWRTALNFVLVVHFPELRLPQDDNGLGQIYSMFFRDDDPPTVEQLRDFRFNLDDPQYAPAHEAAIVEELEALNLRPKTFTRERPYLKQVAHKLFMSKPGPLTTPTSTLQSGLPLICSIEYDMYPEYKGELVRTSVEFSFTSGDEMALLRGLLKFIDADNHRHITDRLYQTLQIRHSISKLADKMKTDVRRQTVFQTIETRGRKIIVSLKLELDVDNNETVIEEITKDDFSETKKVDFDVVE